MKRFMLLVFVLLGGLAAPEAHAQDRYAVFIHGIDFGNDCDMDYEDKPFRWRKVGIIEDWTSNTSLGAQAIDDALLVAYRDTDFYGNFNICNSQSKSDPAKKLVLRSACNAYPAEERIVCDFAYQMLDFRAGIAGATPGNQARWLIVGHSQGGLVARRLHKFIRDYGFSLNVQGVMTVNSPTQGARPTLTSYGAQSGFINVQPLVDDLIDDIAAGPIKDVSINLVLNFLTANIYYVVSKAVLENKRDGTKSRAATHINYLRDTKRPKEYIGPDGVIVAAINETPPPPEYRAVIGVERYPTVARLGGGFFIETGFEGIDRDTYPISRGLSNFLGLHGVYSLDALFEGADVPPGDEAAAADVFLELKDEYKRLADKYRERCWSWWGITCLAGDFKLHNAWKRGRNALEGIETRTTQIATIYRFEQRTGYRTIQVCEPFGGTDPYDGYENTDTGIGFALEGIALSARDAASVALAIDTCAPGQDPYEQIPYLYYVSFADKHDGFLGKEQLKWFPDDDVLDGVHNIYYRDDGPQGGYNHAEVVEVRRRYTEASNGIYQGDATPPMRDSKLWVRDSVFR